MMNPSDQNIDAVMSQAVHDLVKDWIMSFQYDLYIVGSMGVGDVGKTDRITSQMANVVTFLNTDLIEFAAFLNHVSTPPRSNFVASLEDWLVTNRELSDFSQTLCVQMAKLQARLLSIQPAAHQAALARCLQPIELFLPDLSAKLMNLSASEKAIVYGILTMLLYVDKGLVCASAYSITVADRSVNA